VTEIQTLLFKFGSLPAEYSYVWPMASPVVRSSCKSCAKYDEDQKHLCCVPKRLESYKKQTTVWHWKTTLRQHISDASSMRTALCL